MRKLLRSSASLYRFSQLATTNFPYVFGGVPSMPSQMGVENFVPQLFGPDTKQGFQVAYNAILSSLANKEKSILSDVLEPNLTKSLSFQPVKHINADSPSIITITKGYLILGMGFIRKGNETPQFMTANNGLEYYVSMINMSPTSNIPIIMGFNVQFQGKNKLILQNEAHNDSRETHSMQFQVTNSFPMMQLLQMMNKIQGNPQRVDPNLFKQLLIGDNYQWKVSDIDGVLQGNLPNLKRN